MKNNITKILSVSLIVIMLFTMCSCSKKKDGVKVEDTNGVKTWYLGGKSLFDDVDVRALFDNVENKVDADSVFSKFKFTQDNLLGVYSVNNIEKDSKKLAKEKALEAVELSKGSYDIYTIPVEIFLGKKFICCAGTGFDYGDFRDHVDDFALAVLKFATADGATKHSVFSYEIEGNKMIFTQLKQTGYAEEFTYEVCDLKLEYEFSVKGPKLTLKNGSEKLELTAYSLTDNVEGEDVNLSGYSLSDSPLVDELDYFSAGTFNYATKRNGEYYRISAFKMTEDGIIDVYLMDTDEDGNEIVFCKQYAYILRCAVPVLPEATIIFIDNDKLCYYTDNILDREERELKAQGTDTGSLTEDEIKAIAEKKSDLFDDLQKAFEEEGIKVTINRSTGEIVLDTSVLFGGDSAEVTAEGKAFLNKFLKAYTSIIFNEKYSGFISKTMIEGHIAPVNNISYESGLPFSQKRAESVKEYCLSGETGVDTSKLAESLETIGYSQSRPVYDNDGNIDFDASRRVSFRFIVNIEK